MTTTWRSFADVGPPLCAVWLGIFGSMVESAGGHPLLALAVAAVTVGLGAGCPVLLVALVESCSRAAVGVATLVGSAAWGLAWYDPGEASIYAVGIACGVLAGTAGIRAREESTPDGNGLGRLALLGLVVVVVVAFMVARVVAVLPLVLVASAACPIGVFFEAFVEAMVGEAIVASPRLGPRPHDVVFGVVALAGAGLATAAVWSVLGSRAGVLAAPLVLAVGASVVVIWKPRLSREPAPTEVGVAALLMLAIGGPVLVIEVVRALPPAWIVAALVVIGAAALAWRWLTGNR